MTHSEVQQVAKNTMQELRQAAKPGITESELVDIARKSMEGQGIKSYWYHGLPALLYAGHRTVLSLSASEYAPTDYALKENDMFTVDLSPEVDSVWSDYARTIVLQDGVAVETEAIRDPIFRDGVQTEDKLHAYLAEQAQPEMTFSQLHGIMNDYLVSLGYKNLDFLGNFGHSIVEEMPTGEFFELVRDGRIFFDANCHEKLSSVNYFTFEPHIQKPGVEYGFKREDIYHFVNGKLRAI